ncbi:MAG: Gfo/Idh/MocA family oxidoreductase [Chloroflexi bacterium]|nr:Gfo/Idh/MocA family oxidoreductase [Chloroflexota bacterium]
MRYLVAGLGNIGQRRTALLGARCVATADPFNPIADYRSVKDAPLNAFDAAVLAIPDDDKIDLVTYLLEHGKHVLVEKPLPLPDAETVARLESLAHGHGVALYTAYNHRFEPMLVAFKEQMDAGAIGEVYHGRLFYGNGTVKHVAGTWRDQGLGAIQDLSCHLLDLMAFTGIAEVRPGAGTAGGEGGLGMQLVSALSIETVAPDRAIIMSSDGRFVLEMMYHSWRNNFAFELYGHDGSIHCLGLRKWGGSELIVRKRVFPSGRPEETRQTDQGVDVTWELEVEYFERLCAAGGATTDLATDWWIAKTLRSLEAALGRLR